MTITTQDNIPKSVLDQAFQWAVVLSSGTQTSSDQHAFDTWLDKGTLHKMAWQRIQLIDQEFSNARPAADSGTKVLKQLAQQRQRNKPHKRLAALLSIALLIGLVFSFLPQQVIWQAEYATTTGEQQHIPLNGGTQLYLDSNTTLNIDYRGLVAHIQLYRGQVFIDSSAAAPENKPVITTKEGRLIPIGTRFNVQKTKQTTELSVTEGQVILQAKNPSYNDLNSVKAIAGEHWQVTEEKTHKLAPSGLNPEAWLDGIIEADNAKLGDVLHALDQHRQGWLRFDQTTAELRVTGVFRLDDTDSALKALEASMPLKITRLTPWWVSVAVQ